MENGNNNTPKFGDDIEITAEQMVAAEAQGRSGSAQLPDEIIADMGGQSTAAPEAQISTEEAQAQSDAEAARIAAEAAALSQPNGSSADAVTELSDQQVFEYLSKAQGREIKSYDDLIIKEAAVNPLDSDPYTKAFFEWRQKTGRTIEEFAKFNKDWSKENDLKVAEEFLKISYPDFTQEEIDFKMKKLIPSEYDDEDVAFEKRIALKELASTGRASFESMKSDLGNPTEVRYSEEVQADLQLAKAVKEDYQENQKNLVEYTQGIISASSNLQALPLKINDELTINFNISEERRKSLPQMIATMPEWHNEDGSWNHQKVVESGIKALYFDEILKTATEQAFNAGKESILKQGNNIIVPQPNPSAANQQPESNQIIVEGNEDFLRQRGTSVRFGSKFKK